MNNIIRNAYKMIRECMGNDNKEQTVFNEVMITYNTFIKGALKQPHKTLISKVFG